MIDLKNKPRIQKLFDGHHPKWGMKKQWVWMVLAWLTFVPVVHTQTVQDDFEGNGTIDTWFGDDCGINTQFPNPFPQGINTSEKVLEYKDDGGQYANVRFDISTDFDLSAHAAFSFKIYVPSSGLTGNQPNQVSLKLQDGTMPAPWATQSEIIKPIILNQWQTIHFDFKNDNYINLDPGSVPPIQRKDFNRVLIQVNGENNNDRVVAYMDDFLYDGTLPVQPVFDQLVWSDEFDTDGAVDMAKWFPQTQLPLSGSWFNGEIQHYTNRPVNASVSNGILSITAKKENFTDQGFTKQYTSARLNSKFAFMYGRVEVRAKLPFGTGTWPAIWMLGKNIDENGAYWDNEGFGTTGWPACGEIDIMEHWGDNQNYVQSATHTPSSFGATVNLGGQWLPTASSDFHVYALDWTSEKLVFSVDGQVHYTYDPDVYNAETWPFDAEQYILLNVAVLPSISPAFTQSALEVDYVRVYQQSTAVPVVETQPGQAPLIYTNPVNDVLRIDMSETTVNEEITLRLYQTDGKLVSVWTKQATAGMIYLDGLSDLESGMYIVVFEANGQLYSLKMIKN